jgi:opacity protein-like surface antigen
MDMNFKKWSIASVLILIIAAAAVAADFNGTWTAAIDTQIGVQNYTYTFKVEGEKLTGKTKSQYGESEITGGVVKGDDITFVENLNYEGMPLKITYKGKISGDEIKFTRNVADISDETFVAKRAKQ